MSVSIRKATIDEWRVIVELIAVEVRCSRSGKEKTEQLCNELPDAIRSKISESRVVVAEYNGRLVGAAVGVYTAAPNEETKHQLEEALQLLG